MAKNKKKKKFNYQKLIAIILLVAMIGMFVSSLLIYM